MIVAVGIPAFFLIAAMVLDFGNWYAHKRLVQNQVDAAAFAAGVAYGFNFPACTDSPSATANIVAAATEYGSPPNNGSGSATVNEDPCRPQPVGDYASPAGTMWTQVTVKDTVASLFGGFGIVPTISASARVAVMGLESATGLRPFAAANALYTTRGFGECAWATLHLQTGERTVPLEPDRNDPMHFASPPNSPGLQGLQIGTDDAGVSVTLGDCTHPSQRVTYDDVGFIRSYDSGGQTPHIHWIELTPSGACAANFVARDGGACRFGVRARVAVGTCDPNRPPQVTASFNGSTLPLTQSTPCAAEGVFESSETGQVDPGDGTSESDGNVRVRVDCSNDPQSGVPGTCDTAIQQIMAGDDVDEGPIADFRLSETNAASDDPDGFDESIDLFLRPLGAKTGPVVLRGVVFDKRNLSGTVDCSGSVNAGPAADIPTGCAAPFAKSADGTCSAGPPADCVGGVVGEQAGPADLTAAYGALWAPKGSCTSNHWLDYPTIPRGDPRLITVFVTRVGSAFVPSGSPGAPHPIIDLASFYVTGWQGAPSACANEAFPPATAATASAAVWGHFVKFVLQSSSGTPTNQPCTPPSTAEDLGACIATLVQ